MSQLILPPASALYQTFAALIETADLVFFAGLPGVGKSLLLQQLALLAGERGRPARLLQWDVARQPFESPRYPLENGATHPLVIRATGLWLRQALAQWAAARQNNELLIGELPLIGGRFIEIARPAADAAEALLRGERAQFLVPAPSRAVRQIIEARRAQSIAAPQHQNEAQDAPPKLLRALWQDLYQVARQLDLLANQPPAQMPYTPEIYVAVYLHLLRFRRARAVYIDQPLKPRGSVYAYSAALLQMQATAAEAQATLAELEAAPPAGLWHEF